MVGGLFIDDVLAYIIFGIILNFLFSFLFGLYLSQNIGMETMMQTKGEKEQKWWMPFSLVLPYAKMFITLYRVAILQIYFLNQGRSHQDFWIYLTHKDD